MDAHHVVWSLDGDVYQTPQVNVEPMIVQRMETYTQKKIFLERVVDDCLHYESFHHHLLLRE